jgi:hypothetical protein
LLIVIAMRLSPRRCWETILVEAFNMPAAPGNRGAVKNARTRRLGSPKGAASCAVSFGVFRE